MSPYCFLIGLIPFGVAIAAIGAFSFFDGQDNDGPPEDSWCNLRDWN